MRPNWVHYEWRPGLSEIEFNPVDREGKVVFRASEFIKRMLVLKWSIGDLPQAFFDKAEAMQNE